MWHRNNRRGSKQLQIAEEAIRLQRRIPKNEQHEMEVEIEKVVKAWKEAQSAAEIADREKRIADKKRKKRTTSSTRRRESGS